MTTKEFFIKLVQRLEIGHAVGQKRRIVQYGDLEKDELILWIAIGGQYDYFAKQCRWRMGGQMTPTKVEELRVRMRQVFRDLMAVDITRDDYENLEFTKLAYTAWQDAIHVLTVQYALA